MRYLIAAAALVALGACDALVFDDEPYTYESCVDHTVPVSVTYEVESWATPGTVDITISTKAGTSQYADVDASTPWTYDFGNVWSDFTFVYVSAQNQQDHGSISVTIYVDGVYHKSATSAGAYVIATASDSIDPDSEEVCTTRTL